MDFGSSEAEAFGLGRDLETASLPLHDVVVADGALVQEAADATEILWSGAPGFFGLARRAGKAPVVVGKKAAEDLVGGFDIGGAGQAQFAGEAILKDATSTTHGPRGCLARLPARRPAGGPPEKRSIRTHRGTVLGAPLSLVAGCEYRGRCLSKA